MAKEYIITMTAANRVGILSAVTKALSELGADLREASQTVVRGFFTMIFSAEFPDQMNPIVITDHLQDVCRSFDIETTIKDAIAERDSASIQGEKFYTLRLGGDNQKGVLRKLSATIAMSRIDIAGMHAIRTKGGDGFEMFLKMAAPKDFDMDALTEQLNQVGSSFNITADVSNYK